MLNFACETHVISLKLEVTIAILNEGYCHAFNEAQARTGNAIAAALDFTSFPKGEVSENKRTEMPLSERIIAHNSDVAKDI